ncbi:MAG: oligosaccharide flippase family protein [Myxococcales bacterium]|nr:oligosaccharide flippase family protein [Myxococcales bacterium]
MTRFLLPDEIGEVSVATILCMSANWLTIWGFGQYAVVKGRGDAATVREVTWHATLFYVVLGVLALGTIALIGGHLTPLLDAPDAALYVPGMALAIFIRRLGAMPERILTRDMNFRASGLSLAIGEAVYTATALLLAWQGYGGMSVVLANIVQSCVVVAILIRAAGVRSWATPARFSAARAKDMLKFGVPLGVQGIAHAASRYWDNLAISHFFGTGAVGAYNMAYNLADIPAIQVGEQIALVLMPSMASLPPERRPRALERSSALLSLIIFPLAVGLGLVAYPLISLLLPDNDWQEVAPLLTVLACLSIFRPVTWVMSAYMEAECKTNRLMLLEIAKVALLLLGIWLLQPYGLRAAAGAVGLAFGLTALAGIAIVAREGASPYRLFLGFFQPLLACIAMGAAVYGTWLALSAIGWTHPGIVLVAEIVVGAVAYVAAALVVCRETSKDLLGLLKTALRRRAPSAAA